MKLTYQIFCVIFTVIICDRVQSVSYLQLFFLFDINNFLWGWIKLIFCDNWWGFRGVLLWKPFWWINLCYDVTQLFEIYELNQFIYKKYKKNMRKKDKDKDMKKNLLNLKDWKEKKSQPWLIQTILFANKKKVN